MAMTINTTSGQQVEGLRIKDPLIGDLMPTLNDAQKAQAIGTFLKTQLVLSLHFTKGWAIDAAVAHVNNNTEVII